LVILAIYYGSIKAQHSGASTKHQRLILRNLNESKKLPYDDTSVEKNY